MAKGFPEDSLSQDAASGMPAANAEWLSGRQSSLGRFKLLAAILVILLLCLGLAVLTQIDQSYLQSFVVPRSTPGPIGTVSRSSAAGIDDSLYVTLPGVGGNTDLFRFGPTSNPVLVNFTSSAGISETLPVVSPDKAVVAFYGIGDTGWAEIYVMSLSKGGSIPITTNTGQTRLHDGFEIDYGHPLAWSPDSRWVAFIARQIDGNGSAADLYVVQAQGTDLSSISTSGNRVVDFVWLTNDKLAYKEMRGDGRTAWYVQSIIQPLSSPQLIATVEPY